MIMIILCINLVTMHIIFLQFEFKMLVVLLVTNCDIIIDLLYFYN